MVLFQDMEDFTELGWVAKDGMYVGIAKEMKKVKSVSLPINWRSCLESLDLVGLLKTVKYMWNWLGDLPLMNLTGTLVDTYVIFLQKDEVVTWVGGVAKDNFVVVDCWRDEKYQTT